MFKLMLSSTEAIVLAPAYSYEEMLFFFTKKNNIKIFFKVYPFKVLLLYVTTNVFTHKHFFQKGTVCKKLNTCLII